MPSIDQVKAQEAAEVVEDVPVSEDDVEILVRVGIQLLNQGGGLEVIKKAIDTSQDPGLVVGQFLAQLIGKMGEELGPKMDLDPRAFLAKGGFLEEILNYIEQQLGLPEEFSDQVYSECVEVIKAAAQDPEPPNQVMGGGVDAQRPPAPGPAPAQGAPF